MKTILKTVCLFALLCIFSTTFAQIEVQFDTPIQVPITTADPTQAGAAYNFVMSFPDEQLYVDVYNPDRVFNFTISRRAKTELSPTATFADSYSLPVVFFDLTMSATNGILPRINYVFRYKYDIISTATTAEFTNAQRQSFTYMWNTAIDGASWRKFRQLSESVAETGNVVQGASTNTAAGDLLLKTSIGIFAKDTSSPNPNPNPNPNPTPKVSTKTPTPAPKTSTPQQPIPNPPVNNASAMPLYCVTMFFLVIVGLLL